MIVGDHETTLDVVCILISVKFSSEEMGDIVELPLLANNYPACQFAIEDIAVCHYALREH